MPAKDPKAALAALQAKFDAHEQAAAEVIRHWQTRAERAEADNRWLNDALNRAENGSGSRDRAGQGARRGGGPANGQNGTGGAHRGHSGDSGGNDLTVAALRKALEDEQAKVADLRARLKRAASPGTAPPSEDSAKEAATASTKPAAPAIDARRQLDSLIGLDSVKAEVKALIAMAEIRAERTRHGLPVPSMSLHLVLTGNPGTGKTTVARIIAALYHGIGLLKTENVVEVTRADLVGRYIGETAPKTRAVIDRALDGVLFIDEAYGLYRPTSQNDYGFEAIEELLRALEDHRDRLVVILAGYEEPMQTMLREANPGLASRFRTAIHFPDYSPDELVAIFRRFCTEMHVALTDPAAARVAAVLDAIHTERGDRFGNGRAVRNLFETCLRRQAERLAGASKKLTRDQLSTLSVKDVPEAREVR